MVRRDGTERAAMRAASAASIGWEIVRSPRAKAMPRACLALLAESDQTCQFGFIESVRRESASRCTTACRHGQRFPARPRRGAGASSRGLGSESKPAADRSAELEAAPRGRGGSWPAQAAARPAEGRDLGRDRIRVTNALPSDATSPAAPLTRAIGPECVIVVAVQGRGSLQAVTLDSTGTNHSIPLFPILLRGGARS